MISKKCRRCGKMGTFFTAGANIKRYTFYGSQVGKAYQKPLYFAYYLTQKYDF